MLTDDEKRELIAADVIERAARAMFEDPTVPAEYTWAQMVEEDPSRADIWRSDARRVLVAAIGEEVHLPAQACDLDGCCDEAAKPNELADQLRGILSESTPTRITAIVERAADALEGTLTEPEREGAMARRPVCPHCGSGVSTPSMPLLDGTEVWICGVCQKIAKREDWER